MIGWIFFGLIVGALAKLVMPGRDPGGRPPGRGPARPGGPGRGPGRVGRRHVSDVGQSEASVENAGTRASISTRAVCVKMRVVTTRSGNGRERVTYDVLTMGRSCIDLYAHQIGVPITEVTSFDAYVGGCPTNISVGTRRLGLRSALLTAVGDDQVADFVLAYTLDWASEVKLLDRYVAGLRFAGIGDQAGFESMEFFLSVMFKKYVREHKENPWEWVREGTKRIKKTFVEEGSQTLQAVPPGNP